jgi:hypothetical protein
MKAVVDRGESVSSMEPLLIGDPARRAGRFGHPVDIERALKNDYSKVKSASQVGQRFGSGVVSLGIAT